MIKDVLHRAIAFMFNRGSSCGLRGVTVNVLVLLHYAIHLSITNTSNYQHCCFWTKIWTWEYFIYHLLCPPLTIHPILVLTNHINYEICIEHYFLAPWVHLCSTSLNENWLRSQELQPYVLRMMTRLAEVKMQLDVSNEPYLTHLLTWIFYFIILFLISLCYSTDL